MDPNGLPALVTGAAAGTGRAIALRLAQAGAIVAVADVDPAGGQGTVRAIEARGGRAWFVRADVRDAKAGLIRFTSTLAPLRDWMGVRVNCVVPDWILTERARDELARMTPEQGASAPQPLPMEEVADAVLALVRDDALAGRVMVLRGGDPPALLDPA